MLDGALKGRGDRCRLLKSLARGVNGCLLELKQNSWGTRSVLVEFRGGEEKCPRCEVNKCPWGTRSVLMVCWDKTKNVLIAR